MVKKFIKRWNEAANEVDPRSGLPATPEVIKARKIFHGVLLGGMAVLTIGGLCMCIELGLQVLVS